MATIIVGDRADPHIQAVAEFLSPDDLVVFEVSRLAALLYTFEAAHPVRPCVDPEAVEVTAGTPPRGWLRRLTPAGWDEGAPVDQRRADAWAQRLTSLARSLQAPTVSWLSPIDDLLAAQNPRVAHRASRAAGIRTSEATADPTAIVDGRRRGNGATPDPGHTADATAARALDRVLAARRGNQPRQHLSVVTVHDRVWIAEMGTGSGSAGHAPMRGVARSSAHWPAVQHAAATLAASLRLGLTCQSWIVDDDGPSFVSLDPHGRWLHLPDDIARPVCRSVADWLAGRCP